MDAVHGVRDLRAPVSRSKTAPPAAPPPDDATAAQDAAQQQALAAQRQAFDIDTDERAELEREREALQALLLAFLKNEDEITKKLVELISAA